MSSDIMNVTSKPFSVLPAEGYVTIRLSGILDRSNITPFNLAQVEFMKDPFPFVIINCEHASSLSKEWIRALLKIQNDLKQYNKAMRLILVSQALKVVLKREGVDNSFKTVSNLREALVEFGLVTKKMLDTDFLNPFLDATLNVLKIQASVTASPGKITVKKSEDAFTGDISGVIGVVSESFNGSVVISFPEATFLKVMSGMLGETYTTLSPDILDGAGELTNMIFGQAKIILNDKGYGIKTALPSVVSGKNHKLQSLTNGPVVIIPFESNAGSFFVEICLSS